MLLSSLFNIMEPQHTITANAMHYNTKGHSVSDFRALIIERVIPNDWAWLLEGEDMWIKRLETKKPHGLKEMTERVYPNPIYCVHGNKKYNINNYLTTSYNFNHLLNSTSF